MKIVTMAAQKGGTGKSTTAHNIAAELAATRCRVLVVDMDPLAILTGNFGITPEPGRDMAAVLGDEKPGTAALTEIIMTAADGIDIAPASLDLAYSDLAITNRPGRENILKKALETVGDCYDFCIVDTPSGLGMLTLNSLAAADTVLIPIQPTSNDIRGLQAFLDTLQRMAPINPNLFIFGILITRYDKRLRLHRQAMDELTAAGLPVFPEVVTQSARIAETSGQRQPLREYDRRNPNNETYKAIAERLLKWQEN